MKTDTQRLILVMIFLLSGFWLWERWQVAHQPPPPPVTAAPATPAARNDVPAGSAAAPSAATSAASVPGAATGTAPAAGEIVTVHTDLMDVDIDNVGGVITRVALLKHRSEGAKDEPYLALQRNAERTFVAQSGLVGKGLPNHTTTWQVEPGPRELASGADTLDVKLAATAENGDRVTLTYTFHRGSYLVDTRYTITNAASAPLTPSAYFQFTRDTKSAVVHHSMAPSSYVGPVIYDAADKYKKVDFGEIDKDAADPSRKSPYTKNNDNGWVAMVEHYFVTAWVPSDAAKTPREFYTRKLGDGLYSAGVIVDGKPIAPGATGSIDVPLYVGPQDQQVLGGVAKGLDLVVDYGIFTIIAAPLFIFLKWLHGYLGNWGWSIVVMTIVIKGFFYPLNARAARSMAKMKLVAPKMKALQEQYGKDKQQLQIRMMELYKTEKINPLGGCLPILVQIPVFISLYWVLLSAIELRHAPWIGWIHDLAAPDPYFILPVLYAISAWAQVKLSPTPATDPIQQKMFQIMPIAFSVMFVFFPSGLVLYWLVNNLLQIAQQWHVNRMLERDAATAAAKKR
ncbi:MAG TPA: membrane protein insertase YidC [Casimicrobiaceae bacterium]|jgi:YidC/Oxa1 family membrane protein insertase|nr:membrane protein insertase YidC [Casimicrobiaceae bacterium]